MYSYGSPTHGRAKAGRPARTYIQQLCENTGSCPEDLPRAMNDREDVAREGQGYPCCQHDMMMMIYIYIYIYIYILILHIHSHTHIYTYIHIYIHNIYIYIYYITHTLTYIYTYIHT